MSSLRNLRRLTTYSNHPLRPRISTITTSSIRLRPFSQTSLTGYPRKGFEDRDSINAEATEYSKSGTDNAAAEEEEAAFDPSKTDPKEELKTAGKGNEVRLSLNWNDFREMGLMVGLGNECESS